MDPTSAKVPDKSSVRSWDTCDTWDDSLRGDTDLLIAGLGGVVGVARITWALLVLASYVMGALSSDTAALSLTSLRSL